MKSCYLFVLISISSISFTAAQKIDLTNIRFTENATSLLKGIPFQKRTGEHNAVTYKIKDPKRCTYSGIVTEYEVEVGAQNGIVSSYYAHTQRTVITNQLLKALVTTYKQPTIKVKDNGDIKAYYWETPQLFIQFMTGKSDSPHNGVQVFSFIHVSTLKALKAGADPDFAHVYELLQGFKSQSK